MVDYSYTELPLLQLTCDHEDSKPVGEFTDLWLDESGKYPRVMAQVKFHKDTAHGVQASMALKTRWYDAISPEWRPLSDKKTGKVVAHLLGGASITPIPRQKGGEHGTWVFGYPAQKKALPSNDTRYKVPFGGTDATHHNSSRLGMSDDKMMKASADAPAPMDVVEPAPAVLQGIVEGTTQSHPSDTNRGGKAEETDVTLRSDAYATLQARLAEMSKKVQEQAANNEQWAQYRAQLEAAEQTKVSQQQEAEMRASMETARKYRDEVWRANYEKLSRNPTLRASMDVVDRAIAENKPELIKTIDGHQFLLSSMKASLDEQSELEEQKKMEEMREKIRAEEKAKFEETVARQLGTLQTQFDNLKAVPLPPPVTRPTQSHAPAPTPPAAPMDIVAPMKASLDSGMAAPPPPQRAPAVDKFEQMYGIPRDRVDTQVTLKASLDNTSAFVRDGQRSVGRTEQRFRDIHAANQCALYEQMVFHGGQLPAGVPPLCLEDIVRAALDTPIGERAVPWKPNDRCINPQHNQAGVMMVHVGRFN